MKKVLTPSLPYLFSCLFLLTSFGLSFRAYSQHNFIEESRIVKRVALRDVPMNGIIRLYDEHCPISAHVGGVRLVYTRNDHHSIQGQDWSASLSYDVLRPQDLDDANNTAANTALESGLQLAIGEQTTSPYLQTFIAANTHTLVNNLGYRHYDGELRVRINGLPVWSEETPTDVYVELELYETSKLPFNPEFIQYHFGVRQAQTDLVAAWDYVETAYEYELEWVWIDAYDAAFNEVWLQSPEQIFAYREGVSVQTTNQYFIFPNTFLQGRVFYRVRAIGRYQPENVPQYGEWNYGYDQLMHQPQLAFLTIQEDYERELNWQSVTSFVEEGKYKKVLSYHDGTGRNRQVVTHLSSEKRTLIAETLYDYEGNPTVNILPVPLEGTNLAYHSDLNPFEGANPFSKHHYDNEGSSSELDNTSGAAQYYSANNTTGGRFAERLPDAEGFAYSRTTYLRDGTGRVREQGGLGATYQVGSAHATKMYYGSASQAELTRLFGDNVGKASYYRKQITADPNGQLSVSYLDAAGQVIATALTGQSPDNVVELDSYEARTIDVDLEANNLADTLNRRLISENTLFNNLPGTVYDFHYRVGGKASNFMNTCLTCKYELTISIYDENGVAIDLLDPTDETTVLASGTLTQQIDPASCSAPEDFSVDFKVILPEIGTYQVRKVLQVVDNSEEIHARVEARISNVRNQITTRYINEAQANNPCDICFSCYPDDYDPLSLLEGMDCESILAQLEAAVEEDSNLTDVTAHPEYCHYQACQAMTPSNTHLLKMGNVVDWNAAHIAYNLPTILPTTPAEKQTTLEEFIDQDPLFGTLFPAYRNQLRDRLMHLSAWNGAYLNADNGDPISIWELINPQLSPSSYSILFENGQARAFEGVNLQDANAVAERQWELFQSRYRMEYEKVKKKILTEQYSCAYLGTENAIVQDPTQLPENDAQVDDFEDNFDNSVDCSLQVQLWMGQLQNACDNPSVDWNAIRTQLENYCAAVDPIENPAYVLFETDATIMAIKNQLANACPQVDLSGLVYQDACTNMEMLLLILRQL